nr:hypothetical protein GCM10025699_71010 [Microbacterium flavescens]
MIVAMSDDTTVSSAGQAIDDSDQGNDSSDSVVGSGGAEGSSVGLGDGVSVAEGSAGDPDDELVLDPEPSLVPWSVSAGLGASVAEVDVSNRDSSTKPSKEVGPGTDGAPAWLRPATSASA